MIIGWVIILLLTAAVFYVIYNSVSNNLARASTKAMFAQSMLAITQYQAVVGQIDRTLPTAESSETKRTFDQIP